MDELTKTEEMLLIAIWRLKNEAYGYRIRKYISELIGKDFTYGNLYSVLSQLVKKGYIDKSPDMSAESGHGKPKVYYTVSRRGVESLKTSRKTYSLLWDGISDYTLDSTK